MQSTPCSCLPRNYLRLRRPWWMRLISRRRLYMCAHCRSQQLLPYRLTE